jgi:DNA-directed RNA polymerase subunit RPC12/RpoP
MECGKEESLVGSGFCNSCNKVRDDKWHTCKHCGHKEERNEGKFDCNWVIDSCCKKCRDKIKNESDFKEAQEDGKITRDNSIMCPYCGYIDEYDIYDYKDSNKYRCSECNKESSLSVEYTVHYTTEKVE